MSSRIINILTIAVIVLIVPSTLISILNNDIYQDGAWANTQWLGQDLVTLFIAVPLFWLSNHYLRKRPFSPWKLVQTGVFLYFTYTYTFFVFEAQLTWLYFFQLPIFGISLAGLVLSLLGVFSDSYYSFKYIGNAKWTIVAYQGTIAIMLSVLWFSDIFAHLFSPDHVSGTPTGEAPMIIYTLDLGIIVPLMVVSLIGLIKNRQYGILLTGIMLVKSSTIGFALMAMSISMFVQEIYIDMEFVALWCFVASAGSTLAILFFKNLAHILPLNPKHTGISIEFQEYQLN